MAGEMAEQPARLRQLIGRFDAVVERVRGVAPVPLNGICMVARGSSDHAAVYGRYLLEAATGKPVSLAAPSLHTLYGVDVDYSGQLVIAVSQSGATPEIVRTLQALQDAGGRGLAITNDEVGQGRWKPAATFVQCKVDVDDRNRSGGTKFTTPALADETSERDTQLF